MNRTQLEHLLRASGSVAATQDLIVVGSQAILGAFPEAPPELLISMEADVYPLHEPEKADLIAGRAKDFQFVRTMLAAGLVARAAIVDLLGELPAAVAATVCDRLD